jgi:pimeloyl-ACP methyl ester carboxylesterase
VEELKGILESCASFPVTLVGHSWGAWLGYIYAARYPAHVAKLILVASGPFLPQYAEQIMPVRMSRLTDDDRHTVEEIMNRFSGGGVPGDEDLALFGKILAGADSYDALDVVSDAVECQTDLHIKVWGEADELRRSGALLAMGKNITCPVVAIHGDYDPHPAEGVWEPLSGVLGNFRFTLLEKCGHEPWAERWARDSFFKALDEELEAACG